METQKVASASVTCDRVIFMPASIAGRAGYQIVGKSDGVRADELEFIESYGIPIALNPKIFDDGRRILALPSGRMGVNFLHNIGTGYDGRVGAVYSETLIISRDDFFKTQGDPGIFESFFLKNYGLGNGSKVERLEKVQIPQIRGASGADLAKLPDWFKPEQILESIINGLLEPEKRLVLVLSTSSDEQESLVRNLVMLFPQSMRGISYTTFATEPDRETYFKVMLVPSVNISNLSKLANFQIVRLDSEGRQQTNEGTSTTRSVEGYMASIVFTKDSAALESFQAKYDAYLLTPLKKTATSRDLLNFCYLETIFEKTTSVDKRLAIGMELAQTAPSSQLSEKYYSILLSESARSLDTVVTSRILTSYIVFLFKSGQSEKAASVFSREFQRVASVGDSTSTLEFVSNIMRQISDTVLRNALVGQVAKYLCTQHGITGKELPLLKFLMQPENQEILIQQIESSARFDIIPVMAGELYGAGNEDTAYKILREIFPKPNEKTGSSSNYYSRMFDGLEKEHISGKAQSVLANSVIKYWSAKVHATSGPRLEIVAAVIGAIDYALVFFLIDPTTILSNELETFAWFIGLNSGSVLISGGIGSLVWRRLAGRSVSSDGNERLRETLIDPIVQYFLKVESSPSDETEKQRAAKIIDKIRSSTGSI